MPAPSQIVCTAILAMLVLSKDVGCKKKIVLGVGSPPMGTTVQSRVATLLRVVRRSVTPWFRLDGGDKRSARATALLRVIRGSVTPCFRLDSKVVQTYMLYL